MRISRVLSSIAVAASAAMILTACTGGGSGVGSQVPAPSENVTLTGSPTFDAIKARDKVVIGVKEDQPGLGYLDVTTNERSGFDVDIARWIAATLGYGEDKIEYIAIASANRETAIVNGQIDYYVGTYSITDKRKGEIDFAGPYFITGQGFLVRADSGITKVEKVEDFTGKTVCSATGSTPIQNIKDNFPQIKTQEYDIYSACVQDLRDGKVDAVTTDQAILIGYAARYPSELKVAEGLFTTERYGIGLPKGDDALRAHINDMFANGGDTWKAIFNANLGDSGIVVDQPTVDRY